MVAQASLFMPPRFSRVFLAGAEMGKPVLTW
jgi:hypothetical protein